MSDESTLIRQQELAFSFRDVMSHLAGGVTVVTSALDGSPVGMTATAVCSVSVTPPTVLVSLMSHTRTALGVGQSRAFAIHLLTLNEEKYAERFAGPGDRFADVPHLRHSPTGVPMLQNTAGYCLCEVAGEIAVADHTIFFGRVIECEMFARTDHPLLYYARAYRTTAAVPVTPAAPLEPWGEEEYLPGWGFPI
jgi:flavin reductase (DIM6/NTAB) family NADH-FMN oxidoreductase RutF